MPNHAYQLLKFSCWNDADTVKSIAEALAGENGAIDFEKIIQPPANMFRGDLGQKEREYCQENNLPNWMDWQTENWGTKWNAYRIQEPSIDEHNISFRFCTAWSIPMPVIDKIFEMFGSADIEYLAADDGGWFAYRRYRNDGKTKSINWDKNNDPDSQVREALFEALNFEY